MHASPHNTGSHHGKALEACRCIYWVLEVAVQLLAHVKDRTLNQ